MSRKSRVQTPSPTGLQGKTDQQVQSQKTVATTPVASDETDAGKEKSPFRSVVQFGLPLALAALTGFGVVGYAVGRAYLEGWYDAAGVSPLTFNWDLQYIVLRGLAADVVNLWMLFIAIVAAMILCLGGLEFISVWISEWRPRAKPQPSGAASTRKSPQKPHVKKFLQTVLFALMLLSLGGVWFSGSRLLNKVPKEQGARDFYALVIASTCPEHATVVNGVSCATNGLPLDKKYAWVDVRSPVLEATAHGWLLQQQGSTVLLLTHGGVDLLTFGDSPFSVSNSLLGRRADSPDAKLEAVPTPPRFKPEPESAAISAATASVAASAAVIQGQPSAKSTVRTSASPHTNASVPVSRSQQH